jgi:hypothetical protein
MDILILTTLAVLGFVGIIVIGLFLYKRIHTSRIVPEDFENLTLEEIISWFKKENMNDTNTQPILVDLKKEKQYKDFLKYISPYKEENFYFLQGFFDKKEQKLSKFRVITAQSVSEDLKEILSKESIIIFE